MLNIKPRFYSNKTFYYLSLCRAAEFSLKQHHITVSLSLSIYFALWGHCSHREKQMLWKINDLK